MPAENVSVELTCLPEQFDRREQFNLALRDALLDAFKLADVRTIAGSYELYHDEKDDQPEQKFYIVFLADGPDVLPYEFRVVRGKYSDALDYVTDLVRSDEYQNDL